MGFFYSQFFVRLPYPTGNFAGKTIVITGSNTGLGKEAARHYVRLGASRLILAVRSLEKGYVAKQDIEATTKCAEDLIQVWEVDMSSYASVQRFAARVNTELNRVDIFQANAGVAKGAYSTSEDNETMITVNFVATFLLCALVMPKLRESAARYQTRPTFSITGSGAHRHTQFRQKSAPDGELLATVNDRATAEAHWDDQYPVSKLLPIFIVRSLAEQHPADKNPVTVNMVDPGVCLSELARESPSWGFWLFRQVVARSTEVGSRTLVHGGGAGADTHGQYLADCAVGQPSDICTGSGAKVLQNRVWSELARKLETIKPGVTGNF